MTAVEAVALAVVGVYLAYVVRAAVEHHRARARREPPRVLDDCYPLRPLGWSPPPRVRVRERSDA